MVRQAQAQVVDQAQAQARANYQQRRQLIQRPLKREASLHYLRLLQKVAIICPTRHKQYRRQSFSRSIKY
jgi:hypothetical protein